MDTQPITQEQAQQAIADVVQQHLDQTPLDASPNRVEDAHLSASIGIAENAQGRGWITYVDPNLGKVYIETGRITRHQGTFGGGGGLPGGPALPGKARPPHQLVGKTGTFKAAGHFAAGAITFFVEGRQAAATIPLAGGGLPFQDWYAEGEVTFTKVV